MASSAPKSPASAPKAAFKSRDEFKKAKELEEARKAGTALPEQDEDGNDINPHIPQYIAEAPWYVPTKGPTLKHQRNLLAAGRRFDKLGDWYARGQRAGPAATKFRKGACENCGAITHKRKDCLERPRAKGAKWTGADIAADDVVKDINLDWEGKRDRWNGYDARRSYPEVQEKYAKLEAERLRLRAEKLEQELRDGKKSGEAGVSDDDDDEDDEDRVVSRIADDANPMNGKAAKAAAVAAAKPTPATVRNLRIREDTAKYLRNLDVNSAYYDPKTRSMRADPNPETNAEDKDFAGDNFVRYTGDVKDLARMELHSLKAAEDGRDLPHMLAEPTTAEEVFQDFASRKESIEKRRRADVFEKYGGQEHLTRDPDSSGMQQSEAYVEYNRDGLVVGGKEADRPVSKYPEDIFESKHTSVWGSYYVKGAWGYDCCYQTSRNAYCTGEAGKRAARELEAEMEAKTEAALKSRTEKGEAANNAGKCAASDPSAEGTKGSGLKPSGKRVRFGDEEGVGLDASAEAVKRQKIKDAMQAQAEEELKFEADDRRRGFNSSRRGSLDVTEEELEAYRLRKIDADDPMAKHIAVSRGKKAAEG